MKSEPVPRVPRRRRPAKKRQRHSDTGAGGRSKPATYNQHSFVHNERALKQRTLLTDRTHQRTVSHINAEKTKFSRKMNRQETDLLNRLMELEACLPKIQGSADTTDTGKPEKVEKARKEPMPREENVVTRSTSESSSSDNLLASSEESGDTVKSSSSPRPHDNENFSAPELEKDVQNPAVSVRLSPVLEESEEGSTVALPTIPPNTSDNCVVCDGNAKQPYEEHSEVTKKELQDVTDDEEGVRLPQIDQLSEEEKEAAKLNPGLPRSLLRAKIRKRSTSFLPKSNFSCSLHFPKAGDNLKEGHSSGGASRDKMYPLERKGLNLPPVKTDRDYGRRTWPGSSIELVGMNGYTSDVMPKVMQASYSARQYGKNEQGGNDDRLPTVTRSRALIRRTQNKPSRDMYVWLGLDSKYQLRLMTNPRSVSHTDKS